MWIYFRTDLNTAVNGFLDSVIKTYGAGKAVKLSARQSPTTHVSNKHSLFVNRNGTRTLSQKVFRKLRYYTYFFIMIDVLHCPSQKDIILIYLYTVYWYLSYFRKFSKKSINEMMKGSRSSHLYLTDVKVNHLSA